MAPPPPHRRSGRPTPRPFLKWAGGKTQLLPKIAALLPRRFGTYHEPFVGSGAVFFYLRREGLLRGHVHLSDINAQLINTWEALQQDVEAVITALSAHRNDRDWFYEVRAQDPATLDETERAARMIFLNRTCYNGLYRVNKSGRFNVPFGRYANPRICDEDNLRAVSRALQGVELSCEGFASVVDRAARGDFVYLDPPYQPRSPTSYFTAYHQDGFGEDEQQSLREVIDALHKGKVHVMLSNSDTDFTADLYDDGHLTADIVWARRNINSDAGARGEIREMIVRNYSST